MRLFALLALMVAPALPSEAPDVETFYHRLMKLDETHELMMHALCGWPDRLTGVDPPPCTPTPIDAKRFKDAREAAKKFYGLVDPK